MTVLLWGCWLMRAIGSIATAMMATAIVRNIILRAIVNASGVRAFALVEAKASSKTKQSAISN